MAGTCRPDSSLLTTTGIEVTDYEIIDHNFTGSSPLGLFDGTISENNWNSPDVCYWSNDDTKYATIKFNAPCIIWRHGSNYYKNYIGEIAIYKIENNGREIDITNKIEQYPLTATYNWQKYAVIKEPGIYKFKSTGALRIDTEWFLERLGYKIICYDQNNNEIYNDNYLENSSVNINDLPMGHENKIFIGYQKPDGTLFKHGEIITKDITLTPMFVDYEPIKDVNGNIVSVKIKQEVLNLLKDFVDKYITQIDKEG